jgi:hypothetical protein
MRIDLITPFAEKDQVKALGARWDGSKKVWYVQDVEDLEPFRRWLPQTSVPRDVLKAIAKPFETAHADVGVADCGCDVLPWEHCVHTEPTS